MLFGERAFNRARIGLVLRDAGTVPVSRKEMKMRLIGMLDSPFVRRVAIAAQLLELPFEHDALSVFSTFEQFREVNPVVKAPRSCATTTRC